MRYLLLVAGVAAVPGGHALAPADTATTVLGRETRDGGLGTTDAIRAFAVIDAPDLDAAISVAREVDAEVEIRPLASGAAG